MENKINIAELLRDCPTGMELDCLMYDNVYFKCIREHAVYPVVCYTIDSKGETEEITFNWYGKYALLDTAKCVIFPKGKTTWEGFVPPCKFKDGDVISNGICICIYNGNENDKYYGCYVSVGHIDFPDYFINHPLNNYFTKENSRLAIEEEKTRLFQVIKDNGYKWNTETKTLDKLIEPSFKVGDKVKVCGDNLGVIISMRWEIDYIVYKVKLTKNGYETSKNSENLQPYKEETMDKVSKAVFDVNALCCDIMNHLIKEETIQEQIMTEDITLEKSVMCAFSEVVEGKQRLRIAMNEGFELKEENGNFFVYRKKVGYPKTYEECASILCDRASFRNNIGYKGNLLVNLQQLLVCRDAYWKIAGEQMGLGKPWKPDFTDTKEMYYIFYKGYIEKGNQRHPDNHILIFPTVEMRDAFYENFKELIELCKELL